jgi:hypothetical protein
LLFNSTSAVATDAGAQGACRYPLAALALVFTPRRPGASAKLLQLNNLARYLLWAGQQSVFDFGKGEFRAYWRN